MKNKIKNIIFSFTISLMFILIILSFITLLKMKSFNYNELFPTKEDYNSEYLELKTEANNIENKECKNSVIKEINHSKRLFFNKNMSPEEIYNIIEKNVALVNYIDLTQKCNLNKYETEKKRLNHMTLAVTTPYEELIDKYKENYKLTISINYDYTFYMSLINAELKATKYQELERIKQVIEVTKNEE